MLVTLGVAGVGGPIPTNDEENHQNDIILGKVNVKIIFSTFKISGHARKVEDAQRHTVEFPFSTRRECLVDISNLSSFSSNLSRVRNTRFVQLNSNGLGEGNFVCS